MTACRPPPQTRWSRISALRTWPSRATRAAARQRSGTGADTW